MLLSGAGRERAKEALLRAEGTRAQAVQASGEQGFGALFMAACACVLDSG